MFEFIKEFRARRRALDLTQQELADLAGCSRVHLAGIESGKVPSPGVDIVSRINACLEKYEGERREVNYEHHHDGA